MLLKNLNRVTAILCLTLLCRMLGYGAVPSLCGTAVTYYAVVLVQFVVYIESRRAALGRRVVTKLEL